MDDAQQHRLMALCGRAEQLEAERIGNTLVKLGRLIMTRTVERLQQRGFRDLRIGFTALLPHLDRQRGSRVTELAARMGITKQAVGQMVTQLEAAGYVSRHPDPADGRARLVALNEAGFEVLLAGLSVFAELEAEMLAELGSDEMACFRSAAGRARALLETKNDENRSAPCMN
jgi:DNA-binding MarR family transcriptional regulator